MAYSHPMKTPCDHIVQKPVTHPLASLPNLSLTQPELGQVPDDAACFALWDKYGMRDNVRAHSLLVADMATALALRAKDCGYDVRLDEVRASALLHDIAKSYTIAHGGSHAQIGASWVISETGNRRLAQGVMLHVHWPWALPQDVCQLPFFVIYADKRIMHDACVSLDQRFEDLLVRYGISEQHCASIRESYTQGQIIERALTAQLEWDIHACTLDSGRLVQRA